MLGIYFHSYLDYFLKSYFFRMLKTFLFSFMSGHYKTGYGYYIFMDASKYNAGNKARLVSPPFSVSLSGTVCLQFWYHMFGYGMGELNVYVIDSKNSLYKVWSDPPQHEDKWKSGSFAINGGAYSGAFQVKLFLKLEFFNLI